MAPEAVQPSMPSNKVIEPTKWFEVIVDLKTAKQTQRPGAGG